MSATTARTPCTLEAFAAHKRLNPARLRELRIHDDADALLLPCLDEHGRATGTLRVRRWVETAHPTTWRGEPMLYGLQTLRRARELRTLVLVEGESDALTLREHGIPALGIPGSTMTRLIRREHVEGIDRIDATQEPDEAGTKFVATIAERLRELGWAGELRVVDLHVLYGAKDPSELHVDDPDSFQQRWRDAIEAATPYLWEPPPAGVSETRAVRLVSAATIAPRETEYVWAPFIPRGELTWVEGITKSGKTIVALDLIARGTRGEAHPLTGELIVARRAAILTCEDAPDRTIVPRLIAAGANLDRVSILRVEDGSGEEQVPSFVRDLEGIERGLRAGGVDVLLIDGSFGVLGVTDGNDYAEAYRVMLPVVGMVRKLNIAALALRHTRKSDTHALHRGIGSTGYSSLGRSTLSVAVDRDDETRARRLFAHAGSNVGETGPTLAFRVDGTPVETLSRPVGRVRWLEVVEGVTADDLDRSRVPDDTADRAVADEWLESFLLEPMTAKQVFAAADKARLARRTVQRAALRLGVTIERRGFGEGSLWTPPIRATEPHSRRSRQGSNGVANGANDADELPGDEGEVLEWR